MSLSNKGPPTSNKKLSLNPNAAEFVPFALRSPSSSTPNVDGWSIFSTAGSATVGKTILDRSESSISNNSEEEAQQYWRHQLPDDITPDFKAPVEDDSKGINSLPFSSLSLVDRNESSRFFSPSSAGSYMLKDQQESSPHRINGERYAISPYGEDPSSVGYNDLHAKPWDNHLIMDNENLITAASPYNGNSGHRFLNEMLNEQQMIETTDGNPIDFLASQFPGFAAESLAEVYVANGGDLNLTVEMLTQLEVLLIFLFFGCYNCLNMYKFTCCPPP